MTVRAFPLGDGGRLAVFPLSISRQSEETVRRTALSRAAGEAHKTLLDSHRGTVDKLTQIITALSALQTHDAALAGQLKALAADLASVTGEVEALRSHYFTEMDAVRADRA